MKHGSIGTLVDVVMAYSSDRPIILLPHIKYMFESGKFTHVFKVVDSIRVIYVKR